MVSQATVERQAAHPAQEAHSAQTTRPVKEKVLDLANHIGNKKRGKKGEILASDPEYLILEPVVSDEMAEVCMQMQLRTKATAQELASRCGRSVENTHRILLELADAGVCFVNQIDGQDTFWYDVWVPGIMEMMVANKANVAKYPQIAEAFEAYGRVRGPNTSGAFPVGIGLMRVIPIEQSISAETRRASYEEISRYLNDNSVFTVSDCSCRTVREAMGEGCGHLKEDMCIQMGHAAEYYIRTGRGREITREEAFEIIRRAEENGLMHQIPNLDGSGKTHAICNCCGCSCLSLRSAEMFINADMVRSNYISVIDTEKCVACGECVRHCPVNALQLGQKLCSTSTVQTELLREETPRNAEWGPDKWNPEYRTTRRNVVQSGTSPCKTACPAHIAVQGYIRLAAQGKYTEALELIKQENPFPAVCGRICPRSCENECTRGDIDEPVAVDEVKKFIAAQDLVAEHRFVPARRHEYGKKIAVIGAGPSGLSCAYYLAIDGYQVTVFERTGRLGGMLTLGIPSFRLEKDVVEAEIDVLRELGVEFRTGVEVGRDVTLTALREQGFAAFYLAIGMQNGRSLGIEGEEALGVHAGVDFLRKVNLGEGERLSSAVVVVGGGNVAIDVARSAARMGAREVTMYCLEQRDEMPALPEEVTEALEENIHIENGWGPVRILTEECEGAAPKVTGVVFKRCTSAFDAEGRFAPSYDEADTITVAADHVLLSVGQAVNWGELLVGEAAELRPNGTVIADDFTLQTAQPDVFAGGDVMAGAKFAIDAIAQGKEAALSLHRFVQKGQDLRIGRDRHEYRSLDRDTAILEGFDTTPRQRPIRRPSDELHAAHDELQATHDELQAAHDELQASLAFRDTRGTFTEEQLLRETERCLGCGATIRDEFLCVGCGQCTTKCKFDAISLVRTYDGEGVAWEDIKLPVIKNVVKRKGRIALRKAKLALGGGERGAVKRSEQVTAERGKGA